MLTLGQAATAVGKTKTTLANAIKNGRLSATRDDKDRYQIDPSELFRVYPQDSQASVETLRYKTPLDSIPLQAEMDLLRQQVEHLKLQLERELEAVKDLRFDRDKWREQAETIKLLTHQGEGSQRQIQSLSKSGGLLGWLLR